MQRKGRWLFLLAALGLAASCSGGGKAETEAKIVGKWGVREQVDFDNLRAQGVITVFEFTDDGKIIATIQGELEGQEINQEALRGSYKIIGKNRMRMELPDSQDTVKLIWHNDHSFTIKDSKKETLKFVKAQ